MAWVSPTSHNDPDNKWSSETNLYDGITTTKGWNDAAGHFIELLRPAINCDKIRIWCVKWGSGDPVDCDIDLWYDGGWQHLRDGDIAVGDWVEVAIGVTKSVTQARIDSSDFIEVFEFEFNEVAAPPPTGLEDKSATMGAKMIAGKLI